MVYMQATIAVYPQMHLNFTLCHVTQKAAIDYDNVNFFFQLELFQNCQYGIGFFYTIFYYFEFSIESKYHAKFHNCFSHLYGIS